MNRFVTIKSFSYTHELLTVRSLLESEGIECFVKDEFTVRVDPFYSNAIGGAKLQVREEDVPRALEILEEQGLIKDDGAERNGVWDGFNRATSGLPLIGKLQQELRLLMLVAIIFVIAAIIYYFATA